MRFAGEQFDGETGYTYLRARYLNPALGRFTSADSIQPNAPGTQGYNLYALVANNPTTWVDPSGHVAVDAATYIAEWLTRPEVYSLIIASLLYTKTAPIASTGLMLLAEVAQTVAKPLPIPGIPGTPDGPPEDLPKTRPTISPMKLGFGVLLVASAVVTCVLDWVPCAEVARRIREKVDPQPQPEDDQPPKPPQPPTEPCPEIPTPPLRQCPHRINASARTPSLCGCKRREAASKRALYWRVCNL
jgi:RHS repeat-associated protein